MVVAIVRIIISKEQMVMSKKYIEVFLDAGGAANKKTFDLLTRIRNEFAHFLKQKDMKDQTLGWPFKKAESFWLFLKAMIDEKVILAPEDQTQACGLLGALAKQLDHMSGVE